MLMRYNVEVPKEEQDLVTDLAYSWKKLKKDADEITDKLGQEQTQYRKGLIRNVRMFVVDVSQFRTDFEANGPGVPGLPPADANERLLKFKRLYEERERKWDSYVAGEKLFGLPVTQYPELEKTKAELQLLDKLYGLYQNVNATLTEYYEMAWNDVCGFTETPKGQESNISQMVKKLEEFQLACKKMPKELRGWDAYIELKKTVDDFLETLPLVEQLANPALRPRHWKALEDLTGSELNVMSEHFKLSTLLDAGILAKAEDVEEIAGSAVKELAIEGKLNDIANDWVVRNLTFAPFKARGNIILNTGATFEMMEVLEESQMGLGSMLASRFVVPFKDFANEWVDKLSSVSEILEQWTTVQAMWQYLEAVFTSGDIAKQLPQESKRFQGIDKNWVKIMSKGNETPNVINYIYGNDVLKQLLPHMIEQLELCQKALSGYLDQKRAAFPRFFFVADATLLEGGRATMPTPLPYASPLFPLFCLSPSPLSRPLSHSSFLPSALASLSSSPLPTFSLSLSLSLSLSQQSSPRAPTRRPSSRTCSRASTPWSTPNSARRTTPAASRCCSRAMDRPSSSCSGSRPRATSRSGSIDCSRRCRTPSTGSSRTSRPTAR